MATVYASCNRTVATMAGKSAEMDPSPLASSSG
jgi:hypothetical protein